MVLARWGDDGAIREAINLVDAMEDAEDRVVFMGRLGYIRQPEVVEYLKRYLFSDVVYETNSRDLIPVSEANNAAEALGRMLEGFPKKGSIEEQRAWMNAQTVYHFKGVRGNSDAKRLRTTAQPRAGRRRY